MKFKKLILMGGLVALFTHTHTQAQEPKWGLQNSVIDYSQSLTTPLPNIPNPEYTQNAVWDPNGNILIYEADGVIYNKTGGVILDMNQILGSMYNIYTPQIGFTEFIFIPVPKSCTEYYGITTYSNGVIFNNYISDVVWCKIDINSSTAQVIPQSGLKVAKESISCVSRGTEVDGMLDYQMHIETTKDLGGFRYLFASNATCVSVLNVDASGISFMDGYQNGGAFLPNFRSEMEVYQHGNIFDVAMNYYNDGSQSTSSNLTLFEFNMGSANPIISHYHVSIPGEPSQKRMIKGLEYSKDGLTLYATVTTLNSTTPTIIPGKNIIYFNRSTLSNSFVYGGDITSGVSTQDFGLGMLEKGIDGKLWVVGNNRLATLADFNNPISTFTASAMNITNALTQASAYNHHPNGGIPTAEDIIYRKMYLMVDQVDGDNYKQWAFGNNLYPYEISSCSFPFILSIPLNTVVNFFPPPAGMYGGGSVSITHPGTLELIYNQGTACESSEVIKVIEDEHLYCSADFSFVYVAAKVVANAIKVASVCDENQTNILHTYYLYEMDSQGNWVNVDVCYNHTCILRPISAKHQYKVTHVVQNLNSVCQGIVVSDQFFTY